MYIFKEKDNLKLTKAVGISVAIYICSIYIAIFTKTSSSTYIEGLGYKGWFESGNSISAILILSLFIISKLLKEKKYRIPVILIFAICGIYLCTLIGTRTGLYGFVLVLLIYVISEIISSIIRKSKINKYVIWGLTSGIIIVILSVCFLRLNYNCQKKTFKRYREKLIR